MKLFEKEVKDKGELEQVLKSYSYIPQDYEIAVIAYIIDKYNKIIFQRRGPGCRDERFKLETIGGRVKDTDINFRSALQREILEEVGVNANIAIEEFIVCTYATTYDDRYHKEQNWIYLLYKASLIDGEIKIAEPEKNLGYERYLISEVDENELSDGAKELYRIVKYKYDNLK